MKKAICGPKAPLQMTVDEIVAQAIEREKELLDFYNNASAEVGPDARLLLSRLSAQHGEQIRELQCLQREIEELRELSIGMVD